MANKTVGARIRSLRDLRGMSRRELGEAASCSEATIVRVEGGKQSPSIRVLRRLLDALNADEQTRLDLVR